MKRNLIVVAIIIAALLFAGCVSQEAYNQLINENEALKDENEELQTEVNHLEYLVDALATPTPTEAPQADAVDALKDITVTVYEPNSADGVDVRFKWNNSSEKAIKYITFTATPYNAVGDQVWGEIRNKSTINMTVTGPVEAGENGYCTFETVWYNPTIETCILEKIYIEYMDGTTLNVPESALDAIGVTYEKGENKY